VAEPVDTIDARLKDLFRGIQVDGRAYFNQVDDWEPTVHDIPSALFMFSGGTQGAFEIGGITDNRWPWEIEIVVAGLAEGSKRGIARFRDAWPALLDALRADPDLGGACDWYEMEVVETPLQVDYDRQAIYKPLRIVAITTED
jgi:hypothetical protein